MKINKSFSMVELLVAFTVVAIIALMTVPVYSKYRVKSKVSTMVSAASAAQLAVASEYFNQGYTLYNTNYAAGSQPFLEPKTEFIDSMEIDKGWIRINGKASELGGRNIQLVFQPTVVNHDITWTCYASSAYHEYAPEQCRNTGCAVYSWGNWTTIEQGTTWMYYTSTAPDPATRWNSYCATDDWYYGCECYNKTDTNLVKYSIIHTQVDDIDTGNGWKYLVVNHDCRQAQRVLTSQGSCGSCPGGSICQDIFQKLS